MKTKTFLLLAVFVAMASGAFAIVRTVSNNPNSPGQYTSLQAAINAAGITGDTIMVAGSTSGYGDVTISKKIILVGAGYHNPYGYNTMIGSITLSRSNEYVSSSGSKIMGCEISGNVTFNGAGAGVPAINNILIERCLVNSVYFFQEYYGYIPFQYNNDTIRNCNINSGVFFQNGVYANLQVNNIFIHNNIFNGSGFSGSGMNLNTVYVRNNIFINRANSAIFTSINNMVIENNIFYGAYPTGGTGCAFTKNIGYMCPDMPGAGNIGAGNMNSTNPLFVNFPLLGAAFSWAYDFHLQAGSPGKNAGTDGTDIGIYGGMLPLEPGTNPHFPQMMTLTLPSGSSVPAGGTLNVHFTAKKQN